LEVCPEGLDYFLWEKYGDFFERRGRKGFAKDAKKREKKNTKFYLKILILFLFNFLLFVFFIFFRALCETFAPSAFKKSPLPLHP
jgi:hypothetical protein